MSENIPCSAVSEELLAWGEMLRGGVLDAAQLAKDEIPGVLNEVLQLHLIGGVAQIVFGVVGGVATWRAALSFWKKIEKQDNVDAWEIPMALSLVVGGIGSPFAMYCGLRNIVLILVAPRVFLLEYIGGLLK